MLRRAVPILLTMLAGGCVDGPPSGSLEELGSIGQLQARFNRDAGKPRIVLLLSPT